MLTNRGFAVDIDKTNTVGVGIVIHESAKIGHYNKIGYGVRILSFAGDTVPDIEIGDCNTIHDGVRILVGPGKFRMGDWNVIHRDCTFLGDKDLFIGHNCWFGQGCYLDCRGGITIQNGVRMGTQTHVWSHAASGELLEGCTLTSERHTLIQDDTWIVGDHVSIMPGKNIAPKSVILPHSVVTESTEKGKTYAGVPAKLVNILAWVPVNLGEKYNLMAVWSEEFVRTRPEYSMSHDGVRINITGGDGSILIGTSMPLSVHDKTTFFNLSTKQYMKRLTKIERDFIEFLYGNKARFVPFTGEQL